MKRSTCVFFCLIIGLLCNLQNAFAQNANDQTPNSDVKERRFEVGAHWSLTTESSGGYGGRFTVNINKYFAVEAEGNFFPGENFLGRASQLLAGAKVGKRWNKFGIFAKARPGFVHYTRAKYEISGTVNNPIIRFSGKTNFAADLGGVLEFYPTKRIITRFDAGHTTVRIGRRDVQFFDSNGAIQRISAPAYNRHYLQFSAGIGFRF